MVTILHYFGTAKWSAPNTACSRQVGFAPLKGVDSMLKHFPAKQCHLVPPTRGLTQTVRQTMKNKKELDVDSFVIFVVFFFGALLEHYVPHILAWFWSA